jgi:hypothetical protein
MSSYQSKDQRSSQSKPKSSQNKESKNDPRKDKSRRDIDEEYGGNPVKKLKTSSLSDSKYLIQPDQSQDLSSLLNSYLTIFQRIDFPSADASTKNLKYKDLIDKEDIGLRPNYLLLSAIATSQNEYIQNNSGELFKENVTVDSIAIQNHKTSLVEDFKKANINPWSEETGERLTRVCHVSNNLLAQNNPKLAEMEEKLEKLEQLRRDRKKIDAECNKAIHLASLAVTRAQFAVDISENK